jgi:hypothetical protein
MCFTFFVTDVLRHLLNLNPILSWPKRKVRSYNQITALFRNRDIDGSTSAFLESQAKDQSFWREEQGCDRVGGVDVVMQVLSRMVACTPGVYIAFKRTYSKARNMLCSFSILHAFPNNTQKEDMWCLLLGFWIKRFAARRRTYVSSF